MQMKEWRLRYLTVMTKSALVMAALTLLGGVTMLVLHCIKMKAQAQDA